MKVGEFWAYGKSDTAFWFLRVRVLKIEEKTAVVAFIDDDDVDVRKDRVPLRNLKVLWDNQWEYLYAARIREADARAERDAARVVFDRFIPWEVAEPLGREDVEISDLDALAEISGVPVEELEKVTSDLYSIARNVAALHADELLRLINQEERRDREMAWQRALDGGYQWGNLPDESARLRKIALDAGRLTERRNSVLRTWVGQPALDRAMENDQLRLELLAAGLVARRAVDALEGSARTLRVKRVVAELRAMLPDRSED